MQIAVDGATLDVETNGSGPAVVLIHGFPFTGKLWEHQAAALASIARVIRLDLRGMGASSTPHGPYLMDVLASDVAAVMDALSVERAMLVGHSLGGYVALAFARMFAERVERLALVCSKLTADSDEKRRNREATATRLESEGRIEPVVETVEALFAPQTVVERPELVHAAYAIARRNAPQGAAAMLRGMAERVDAFDLAEDFAAPVLIVGGGSDPLTSGAEYERMRTAFPHARLAMCSRSGHLPMLEEPERLTQLLVEFLDEAS